MKLRLLTILITFLLSSQSSKLRSTTFLNAKLNKSKKAEVSNTSPPIIRGANVYIESDELKTHIELNSDREHYTVYDIENKHIIAKYDTNLTISLDLQNSNVEFKNFETLNIKINVPNEQEVPIIQINESHIKTAIANNSQSGLHDINFTFEDEESLVIIKGLTEDQVNNVIEYLEKNKKLAKKEKPKNSKKSLKIEIIKLKKELEQMEKMKKFFEELSMETEKEKVLFEKKRKELHQEIAKYINLQATTEAEKKNTQEIYKQVAITQADLHETKKETKSDFEKLAKFLESKIEIFLKIKSALKEAEANILTVQTALHKKCFVTKIEKMKHALGRAKEGIAKALKIVEEVVPVEHQEQKSQINQKPKLVRNNASTNFCTK